MTIDATFNPPSSSPIQTCYEYMISVGYSTSMSDVVYGRT